MIKSIVTNILELKKSCVPAEPEEIQAILKDLIDTLKTTAGIGLAGNQIGYNKRVTIIRLPNLKLDLINPIILDKQDRGIFKEGCLSFQVFGIGN